MDHGQLHYGEIDYGQFFSSLSVLLHYVRHISTIFLIEFQMDLILFGFYIFLLNFRIFLTLQIFMRRKYPNASTNVAQKEKSGNLAGLNRVGLMKIL